MRAPLRPAPPRAPHTRHPTTAHTTNVSIGETPPAQMGWAATLRGIAGGPARRWVPALESSGGRGVCAGRRHLGQSVCRGTPPRPPKGGVGIGTAKGVRGGQHATDFPPESEPHRPGLCARPQVLNRRTRTLTLVGRRDDHPHRMKHEVMTAHGYERRPRRKR